LIHSNPAHTLQEVNRENDMDCTFAALLACFSWSGLYLDYGAVMLREVERPAIFTSRERLTSFTPSGQVDRDIYRGFVSSIDRQVQNPYGILAMGYEVEFSNFRIDTQLFHMQSTARDEGDTGAKFNLRWFPLR
jgi:hypothetical protein